MDITLRMKKSLVLLPVINLYLLYTFIGVCINNNNTYNSLRFIVPLIGVGMNILSSGGSGAGELYLEQGVI